jgi:hypothetical protein
MFGLIENVSEAGGGFDVLKKSQRWNRFAAGSCGRSRPVTARAALSFCNGRDSPAGNLYRLA